jgi:universal stress protein E
MPAIRKILVAVKDLRGKSQPAVLKAAQLARACGASVELFHTLSTPLYADLYAFGAQSLETLEADLRQQALRRLENVADRLRQHGIRVAVSAEWDFPPYEAVIRRALRVKADLIVASRHAGRFIAPWLLRLTDWELVRQSPIPVLLVKKANAYRHPAVLVAIDPGHAFEKPLQLDKQLLALGAMVSDGLRGSLHVVHAYPRVPIATLQAQPTSMRLLTKMQKEAERSAKVRMARALRGSDVARARRYLIGAHPIDAIIGAAAKSRSALVVMGAVSRSGLKNLLIGNTAERILDELPCDILVAKPGRFKSRVPTKTRGPRLVVSAPMGQLGYY